MIEKKTKYAIIVPCYKSSATIEKVVEGIIETMGERTFEIILVNDGSPDEMKTINVLKFLAQKYGEVTVIDLAKNSGQQHALFAGLRQAEADYYISIDDDLQIPPSQIDLLIDEISKGWGVVYAYYKKKEHTKFRNWGSRLNSKTAEILIDRPQNLHTSSFWIIEKYVRDEVINYKGPYVYIQGLFLRTTDSISCIPVQHVPRTSGQSGYTLNSLIRLWSNVIAYSVIPMRIAGILGIFFSAVAAVAVVILIILKIVGAIKVSGWTSLMICMCFFSGIILLSLGLLGEYVGRIFMTINTKPQYVVRRVYKGDDDESTDIRG